MTYPAVPGQVAPEVLLAPTLRRPRLDRLAGWISNATHPPIVGVVGVAVASLFAAKVSAWLWGSGYLIVAVVLPTLYVAWLVRRGVVSDVQLLIRSQRLKPYGFAIVCMSVAALILHIGNAPRLLQQVALANVVQSAALFLITLRWKISAHSASMGGLAVLMCFLLGSTGLPFCAATGLVAWSRVRLKRHDIWQAVAGAALGAAVAGVALTR